MLAGTHYIWQYIPICPKPEPQISRDYGRCSVCPTTGTWLYCVERPTIPTVLVAHLAVVRVVITLGSASFCHDRTVMSLALITAVRYICVSLVSECLAIMSLRFTCIYVICSCQCSSTGCILSLIHI